MQPVAKAFLQSIFTTLIIATAAGAGVGLLSGSIGVGAGVFVLTLLAQFSLGTVINLGREKREHAIFNDEILGLIKNAKEYRTNTELSCAYCQVVNNVAVSLELSNTFKCKSCNQPNKVYISMSTVRVTQSISKPAETEDVDMEEADIRQTTVNDKIEIT